jgi:hypothetical protein
LQKIGYGGGTLCVAQKFDQYNGGQDDQAVRQGLIQNLNVFAFVAREVRDERTGIRGDHWSFRNCFSLIENLTLPRSF